MLYQVIGLHGITGQEFLIPGPSFDNPYKAAKVMRDYQSRFPAYKFYLDPVA